VLAISVYPPSGTPSIIKYLLDTNEAPIVSGPSSIVATTLSSNATAWSVQLRFDGTMSTGAEVHTTSVLDIPYPQARQLVLPGVGTVTGWFLSDRELLDFNQRMPKRE
jgi:hypothetical protein